MFLTFIVFDLKGVCEIDKAPSIGRIRFNIATIDWQENHKNFQNNFLVCLHEVIHVLGFSGKMYKYWIDPDSGRFYGKNVNKILEKEYFRGQNNVFLLKSKNLLKTTKRHFKCDSI